MGGYNSGLNQRRSRYGRVDGTRLLDVMALSRAGWLKPGEWGTYSASFQLLAKPGQLVVMYEAICEDGVKRRVDETFEVVSVPRHFGGSVPHFVCPGNGCGRRVTKLYQPGGRLRCRQCSNLVYDCLYESDANRAVRRLNKITVKFGLGDDGAQRPKYMRCKTYEKLLQKLEDIQYPSEY